MAGFEHQLVSKIIESGQVAAALDWGISADDFLLPENRQLFIEIVDLFQLMEGATPGVNYVREMFPTYPFVHDTGMTVPALCSLVRKNRVDAQAKMIAEELLTDGVGPTERINTAIRKLTELAELGEARNCDIMFADALTEIESDYEKAARGELSNNLSFPWQWVTRETGGIEDEDYIVLYGRPKSFKSWVLAYFIAHFIGQGKRLLLYTKEMTPKNIFRRVAACLAAIDYRRFRLGELEPEHLARFREFRERMDLVSMDNQDQAICLAGQDVAKGGDTIPWLRAKIEKYRPEIVFVDGIYLMSSTNKNLRKTNERVEDISRNARQMVLATGVPLIATAQANRKAAGHQNAEFDEIAHSDSIGQDATAAFRVIYDNNKKRIIFKVAGSREWALEGFAINAEPATNFEFIDKLEGDDLQKAEEQDNAQPNAPKSMRRSAGKNPPARGNKPSVDSKAVNNNLKRVMGVH